MMSKVLKRYISKHNVQPKSGFSTVVIPESLLIKVNGNTPNGDRNSKIMISASNLAGIIREEVELNEEIAKLRAKVNSNIHSKKLSDHIVNYKNIYLSDIPSLEYIHNLELSEEYLVELYRFYVQQRELDNEINYNDIDQVGIEFGVIVVDKVSIQNFYLTAVKRLKSILIQIAKIFFKHNYLYFIQEPIGYIKRAYLDITHTLKEDIMNNVKTSTYVMICNIKKICHERQPNNSIEISFSPT